MSNNQEQQYQGIEALNKALEMLKVTYPELEIIHNNSELRTIQDEDKVGKPHTYIDMDIRMKLNDKEFGVDNYLFAGVDYTNPIELYFRFIRYIILPIQAGFNTVEEYELSKLPKEEQEYIREYILNNNK